MDTVEEAVGLTKSQLNQWENWMLMDFRSGPL